jgi:hypothetical protein
MLLQRTFWMHRHRSNHFLFSKIQPRRVVPGLHFSALEDFMLEYAAFPGARLYAVEVSGWDRMEDFFVEKCDLEWGEESEKHVVLKTSLGNNALLLVRLLQPREADRSHPVVYEAEFVGKTKSGLHQFRLNVAVPRLREEESSAAWPERELPTH